MRVGFTLVELMITLVLIGVVSGVASLALRPSATGQTPTDDRRLAEARHAAIAGGSPMVGVLAAHGRFWASADGLVMMDSAPTLWLSAPRHAH